MNRRAFLTAVGITPVLGSAFTPLRAQTAGGRLLYVGTYTNNAAGSKGIYGWRFDAETGKVMSLGLAAETDSPAGSWSIPTSDFCTPRTSSRRQRLAGQPGP